jgi:hypothetical protein
MWVYLSPETLAYERSDMISLEEVEIGEYVDAHNDLDLGPLSLYTYIYIDDFHSL